MQPAILEHNRVSAAPRQAKPRSASCTAHGYQPDAASSQLYLHLNAAPEKLAPCVAALFRHINAHRELCIVPAGLRRSEDSIRLIIAVHVHLEDLPHNEVPRAIADTKRGLRALVSALSDFRPDVGAAPTAAETSAVRRLPRRVRSTPSIAQRYPASA
jgi:hypothetical protein